MQNPEATRTDQAKVLKKWKACVQALKDHGDAHSKFMQLKSEVDKLLKMILRDNESMEKIR